MHYPDVRINGQDYVFQALIRAYRSRYPKHSPEYISRRFREQKKQGSATTIRSIFEAVAADLNTNFQYHLADTFAVFLGYIDFIAFAEAYCTQNQIPYTLSPHREFSISEGFNAQNTESTAEQTQEDKSTESKFAYTRYLFAGGFFVVLLGVFFWYFLELGVSPSLTASPQAGGKSTTVYFKYHFPYYWKLLGYKVGVNISISPLDSIIRFPAHRGVVSFTYRQVGYFRPFITLRGKRVSDFASIYLTSKQWDCSSTLNFHSSKQYPYHTYNQDSLLRYKNELLKITDLYLSYRYYHPAVQFPLNDFVLEYTIRNQSNGNPDWQCRDVFMALKASNGTLLNLNFTHRGNNCENWSLIQVADTLIHGQQHPELTKNLTVDLSTWETIALKSLGNLVTIYCDRKPVLYLRNSRVSGKIMGFNIGFRGQGGAIKQVRMWNKSRDLLLFPTAPKKEDPNLSRY
jgi:hypothetical protein